ncbi:hypothetical protein A8135_09505 [Legionella jamestowniensis]|uniref:Transmembrane protein n=1 Tax=Legionella jamestowniensis TaxID=455 RepID=A0ABX2XWL6_9GAMM|nr:hypothetical protein [Legionella jamestowniensis]OCH98980.1 hypothetical protein A8135_09505 [Legionella jamestowniensis]
MRFIKFLRQHWAATAAVVLGLLTAAAAVTAAIMFPPSILAIAGFSAFGFTPFAFLASMATPAAVATIGAMTFAASLAASTLFNAVVGVYNFMNAKITPAAEIKPTFEAIEEDEDDDLEDKGCCSPFKALLSKCAPKSKNTEEEDVLLKDNKHFGNPLHSSTRPSSVEEPASTTNLTLGNGTTN